MEEPWENGMGASVFLEGSSSFVGASMKTRFSGCVHFSSLLGLFVAFVKEKADPPVTGRTSSGTRLVSPLVAERREEGEQRE